MIDVAHLPSYRGESVDIFAIAVTLFVMYLRVFPFEEARPNEQRYKFIVNNNAEMFWATHTNQENQAYLENDFKQLLT